jgi:paraquat-inducible protein B
MLTTNSAPEPDAPERSWFSISSPTERTRDCTAVAVIAHILPIALWLAWTAQPCAATEAPIHLAQRSTDLLQLGKNMLGLGEETPEGQTTTGITNGVPFLVRFRDTVGGLKPGAPVHVRGMQMGAVREVRITFDPATASFDIPVVIELDPTPFKGKATGADANRVQDAVAAMVRKGLRADLAPANLIPGELGVTLELQPDATPADLRKGEGGLLEIPTTGRPFEPLTTKLERISERISALPLEQAAVDMNKLIAAARRNVEDPALRRLLSNLAETSEALTPAARRLDPTLRAAADLAARASTALAEARLMLERSDALPQELESALREFTNSVHSLRLLAEMLERQPQALLRGKPS